LIFDIFLGIIQAYQKASQENISVYGDLMKKLIFTFAILAFSSFVFAQGTTPNAAPPAANQAVNRPLPEVLGWMVGQWEGEGVARDQQFVGRMTVVADLDNTILIITRESLNKDQTIAGGLKEKMMVGVDGTTKKIVETIYDNKNHIALFLGELKQNEIDFSPIPGQLQPGYASQRIFRLLPDGGLTFSIQEASPGKPLTKTVEINFKKKS
jgi:hypothetical protein